MSFDNQQAQATEDPTLFGIDVSAEPSNQEGVAIPYVAGEFVVPAAWKSPCYNQRAEKPASSGGGKGGKGGGSASTGEWTYYATVMCIWHLAQDDRITGLIIDDRLQWSGNVTRPTDGSLYTDISVPGRGIYRHYWGTKTQTTVDPHLTAGGNDYGDDHPAYTGISYGILIDFLMGKKSQVPTVKLRGERTPVQPFTQAIASKNDDGQANPVCVALELLTDTWFGLGQPVEWFAQAKIITAINKAYDRRNLSYCSPLISGEQTVKAVATELFYLFDGFFRSEDSTGLIEIGMFTLPEEIDVGALASFNSRSFVEEASFKPDSWDDVKNTWTLTYRNRNYVFKTDSVTDYDINGMDVIQEPRPQSLDIKSIVRQWQAQNYLTEYKRRNCVPGCSGEVNVRAELVEDVQPGDHVRFDIDAQPGGVEKYQVFRVLAILRNIDGSAKLQLEAERTLAPAVYIPPSARLPDDDPTDVDDIGYARFFEVPWSPYAVGILAQRPTGVVTGFSSYYDNAIGGSYQLMDYASGFALRCRLNALVSDADAGPFQLDILDTVNRELIESDPGATEARDDRLLMIVLNIAANGQIQADAENKAWIEVMSCQSFAVPGADKVNVTALRARKDSKARSFAAGAEVWIVRASDLPVIAHADFAGLAAAGTSGYFKLQSSNLTDERPLALCAAREFSFALKRDIRLGVFDDGVKPNPITGLTAAPGMGMIVLNWTNPDNTPLDQIAIYESATNVRPAQPTFVVPAPQASFFRNGLDDGAARNYWLSPIGKNGRFGDLVTVAGQAASTSLSKSVQDALDGLSRTMAKSVQETADHAGELLKEQQDRSTGDTALDQRATGLEQRATQLEQGAGTMQQNVQQLSQNLQGTQQSLTQTQTVVGDANAGLVKDTTTLKNQVNDPNTGLAKTKQVADSVTQVVGDANAGLVKQVNTLENTVTDGATGLAATRQIATNTKTVVGDANSGLVKDVSTLSNTVTDPNTGLAKTKQIADSVTQVVGDANAGLVKQINTLAAVINNPATGLVDKLAAVEQMATVLASANEAYAKTLSNVIAQIGSDQGAVATMAEASIDPATGKVVARWGTKVTAASNGDIVQTGLEMIAQNGVDPVSAIRMLANILQLRSSLNGADVTPFLVEGGNVYINTLLVKTATITSAMIESLAANKIQAASLSAICATIGLLRTATTGARLEIESNQIRVYDDNNVLRLKFGVL